MEKWILFPKENIISVWVLEQSCLCSSAGFSWNLLLYKLKMIVCILQKLCCPQVAPSISCVGLGSSFQWISNCFWSILHNYKAAKEFQKKWSEYDFSRIHLDIWVRYRTMVHVNKHTVIWPGCDHECWRMSKRLRAK